MRCARLKFTNKKTAVIIVAAVITIAVLMGLVWWNFVAKRLIDLPSALPPTASPLPDGAPADVPLATSVAKNLEIPWSLDFLPDGNLIFTERPGNIKLIDAEEGLLPEPLLTINEVAHHGEGGLLGIAVHPDFAESQFIYVYYTYQQGEGLANKVVRFRKQGGTLLDKTLIIDDIPGDRIHNGGRLKFGPDGLLYITTGDASISGQAQNENSLAGKILRLEDDGTIPIGNQFPDSPIYSLGHRNPQGLAWDDQGRLWATEHGFTATDELNLIQPGMNYGWPLIHGDEILAGLQNPMIYSGNDTWAPSGAAFWNGSIFFAGLRGQSLYEAVLEDMPALRRHLERKFGRLRDVVVGPDNLLYVLTSNRDGRGLPTADDDQIIRINLTKL